MKQLRLVISSLLAAPLFFSCSSTEQVAADALVYYNAKQYSEALAMLREAAEAGAADSPRLLS